MLLGAASICVAGAALGASPGSFCVAGAALGAPEFRFPWQAQHLEHLHRGRRKSGDGRAPPRFARQAQHLEHLTLVLRGRRSTLCGRRSTWSIPCWKAPHFELLKKRSAEIQPRVMRMGTASFCVAGAALGALHNRFAWQAQHLQHLRLVFCGRCSTWGGGKFE